MKKALFFLLACGLQQAYGQKDYTFVYDTDSIINVADFCSSILKII